MSFEPGGRADKLGNRYENWWVVKQLLRVINEEVQSLTLEPTGPEEIGTEFWLNFKDGSREAHQCKARNGDSDKWTVNELKNNEVLANSKYQLDRDSKHKFIFVSAISSISLKDICDSARNSNNPEDFYNYQIKKRGKSIIKSFTDYCYAMNRDPKIIEDLELLYSYLKRTEIIHFVDDRNELEDVLRFADRLFNSNPQNVISLLFFYAIEEDKLGKPITSNELIQYLKYNNIYPRILTLDTRIQPRIEFLRRNYLESIKPYLIKDKLINRSETIRCLDDLKEDKLIMLTGDSGTGKSGVLYELATELEKQSINYLPVRLDQQIPKGTAQKFGEDLGLPASPIHCLEEISKDESVVVIIDQLDSIRWTSSHSTTALAVCKELIHQILYFKRKGRKISLVMACRSFDLKYDVELRNWFSGVRTEENFIWTEIQVSSLSEKQTKEIIGQDYVYLNNEQKQLLMNPQNLHMWTELKEDKIKFISSVDLLRKYWITKMLAIEEENISRSNIDSIINTLVNYMEEKGVISAPSRLINRESELAKQALKSHGILLVQGARIRFSHQSYLDYQIALNIINLIDKGESILDWIGNQQNQTLFRREQLRQALSMMIEEDSSDLNDVIKDILYSKSVRFHLKHLVLEVIRHYNKINHDIELILLDLLKDPDMKSHVLETIFWGNERAIEILLDKKIIKAWIETEKDATVNLSVNLLTSVRQSQHPEIIKNLNKIIQLNLHWKKNIANSLGWNIENDSENIFTFRLHLAEKGIYSDFIDWKTICRLSPIRAIKYIKSILKSIEPTEELPRQFQNSSRIDSWHDHDLKPLIKMAKENYHEIWENLIPEIIRFYGNFDETIFKMNDSSPYFITDGSVELLIEAGKSMAKTNPEALIKNILPFKGSKLIYLQKIIIESFQEIDPEYSTYAVEWFITSPDILTHNPIGWPRYKFSREFIQAISHICSDGDFQKLETFITEFQDENLLRRAQNALNYRKEGVYPHYWGEFQYLLLSELDQNRISSYTIELLNVLKRKFDGESPEDLANITLVRGGIVVSTIDRNLNSIRDSSWISILTNEKVSTSDKSSWGNFRKSGVLQETSIGLFSSSLRKAAKKEPERFGRLALEKLPLDVDTFYLSSIIHGLAIIEPPNKDISNWKKANVNTVIELLEKYKDKIMNREVAMEFCRVIRSREDIDWPLSIVKMLKKIACKHPDPEKNYINIQPSGWDENLDSLSPENLLNNSINCVRGVAADAINSLLFNKPQLFTTLTGAIESLVNDSHPAVRTGVIGMLIPVININREQAIQWFVQTVSKDYRVMCTGYGSQFLNYTLRNHPHEIGEVLKEMIMSSDKSVVEYSSRMIGGYNIIYGYYDDYIEELLQGNTSQKKGVLQSAIQFIENKEYANKSRKLLFQLIEQYDPDLEDEMIKLFGIDIYEIEQNKDIIIKFIKIGYFENIDALIYNLDEYEGKIIDFADFIISICKEINKSYASESQNTSSQYDYPAKMLFELVLKLYEEATEDNNRGILQSCLDIYDEFYKNKIGTVRNITNTII